ncbi:MAG: adenylate/guanylate cyclase domain-containing protein [Alphaproteobacteria bacterium]
MFKVLTNKWLHILILFLLLCGSVSFSGSSNELRKRMQNLVFDSYNKLLPRKPTSDVVIVDLDENSLRIIGQWPWSRDVMAQLISNLKEYGAKAIAFDMVFAEEDRTSPKNISKKLPDSDKYLSAKTLIQELPDNDFVFSQSIKKAGNVITAFIDAKENETRRTPYQPVEPTFLMKDKQDLIDGSYSSAGVATNLPEFSRSAAGNGHFMVQPDTDGIIRSIPLFARYKPTRYTDQSTVLYPALSLEAFRVSVSPKSRMIIRENKNKKTFDSDYEVKIGDYTIPLDNNSKFWVHYRDIKPEEYISAHLLLNPKERLDVENKIKNKIVFIGTSAEGLRDIRSTPLEPYVAGVEVHVNVIEQILQGRFLKRPSLIVGVEAIIIGIAGLAIIVLSPFVHLVWLGFLTLLLIGLMFAGSWYGYVHEGLLLDPVYPSLVLFLLFVGSSLLSYMRSETDRRQVKMAFGHYISPVFMEELTKNPEKLKLGGEVRELTVMFTDIRGFTGIAESLSPEALIQLMNDFLTPMSNLVMESRGTIDKYMGDAMMAFWNAPLDDFHHARQACLTALKMNEALQPINAALKHKADKDNQEVIALNAGIGINTGPCAVGNMGSKQRFAYSAVGDAVNLASRLEGQTKVYGVDTLIGEDTYKLVEDLAFLELDLIQVKGREEAIKIYTLIGDEIVAREDEFKKWQAAHNSMLAAYRIADFSCAAQDCKDAMELSGGKLKKYYNLYKDRIIFYTKNPPPEEWRGVYIAKSK